MNTRPQQGSPASRRRAGLFARLREARARLGWRLRGVDLHPTARFSPSVEFDRVFPSGVHVDAESYVGFGARILSHDLSSGTSHHTRIGRRCHVGPRSLILPGAHVGDGSVIGPGAVVTEPVPPGSLVGGNPARVLREGIEAGPYGGLDGRDATEGALAERGLA